MSTATTVRDVSRYVWNHPANRNRRFRQLACAVKFQVGARLFGRRVCVPIGHHGGRVWVDLHRRAATKVVYANPPDWPHMIVWERQLTPGDLFIDVGANVGTYSVLCASVGAQVIAIEPAPDTAALLRENSALNNGTIEVIEAAVGNKAGTACFTMGRDTINQLNGDGTETVAVITLDGLIGNRIVAGMKMDIEGGELDALRGATTALREHRIHLLQMERSRAEDREPIARLLADAGYEFFMPSESGDLVPTDSVTMDDDLFAAIPDHV